jgi:tetratricopeptide (TPR) repeat protein
MKMINVIKTGILLLSFTSIYIHYLNNESSKVQWQLYQDISQNSYKEASTARFNSLNFDYPNLTLSSLPIKGLAARYYLLGERYNEALDLLNDAERANPYIMWSESLKQEVFQALSVKDSSRFYAEKAFTGIPNNGKHFIQLSKIYANNNEFDKVDSIFSIVEGKKKNDIYKIYLSTWLTNKDSISQKAINTAKNSIKIFGDSDSELKLVSDYVIFGMENIKKSVSQDSIATIYFFNEDYRKAAIHFENAAKLNPAEYTHFENAGISNFKFGYYERSIPYLLKVIDSLNPETGKSEFVLAQVYAELKDFKNACDFIMKSAQSDFKDSFALIGDYCK